MRARRWDSGSCGNLRVETLPGRRAEVAAGGSPPRWRHPENVSGKVITWESAPVEPGRRGLWIQRLRGQSESEAGMTNIFPPSPADKRDLSLQLL